ncbi:unnamed protein product [Musa acuminata subsp. malaccensis]|uniref:(wild Malaysian banana) hypothetical protein n=1 Tax=Musa acuminata subsp. malaccensis TaxID=214687 RepID=A0A804J1X8_MUSAM|nr:unnamed protein product [Musa acuminata subsp. malaccensis]
MFTGTCLHQLSLTSDGLECLVHPIKSNFALMISWKLLACFCRRFCCVKDMVSLTIIFFCLL